MENEQFKRTLNALRGRPSNLDEETIRKASDSTSLCAAIYPFIRDIVSTYNGKLDTKKSRDSFRNEIDHLIDTLEQIVSIPYISFEVEGLNKAKLARLELIQAAVEMAVYIADYDIHQVCVNMRAIMAGFIKTQGEKQ